MVNMAGVLCTLQLPARRVARREIQIAHGTCALCMCAMRTLWTIASGVSMDGRLSINRTLLNALNTFKWHRGPLMNRSH